MTRQSAAALECRTATTSAQRTASAGVGAGVVAVTARAALAIAVLVLAACDGTPAPDATEHGAGSAPQAPGDLGQSRGSTGSVGDKAGGSVGDKAIEEAAADALAPAQAIWPRTEEPPGQHQVALFRHDFELDRPFDSIELHVFADTRYELWIAPDEVFRGPARFDKLVHEYDTYETWMSPGQHSVAVLVQWAPNIRRSESTNPHLLMSIVGRNRDGETVLAATDDTWRGIVSDAWMADSAPIHDWGLIGPAEILDLRLLPQDWVQTRFDYSAWPTVEVVDRPAAEHLRRSTMQTMHSRFEPYQPFAVSTGQVSPDMRLFELIPGIRSEVTFSSAAEASVTIETVTDDTAVLTDTLQLDGLPLAMTGSGDLNRLGLRHQFVTLAPGTHRLALAPSQDRATSVAMSTAGFEFDFESLHALHPRPGERTLLAELVPDRSRESGQSPDRTEFRLPEGAAYLTLDLVQTRHGRLQFRAQGPAGTVLDVGLSERLYGDRPIPYAGPWHPQMSQVDSFVLDGAERTVSTIDARAGRYVLILSHAPDGPVQLSDVTFIEEQYPALHLGSFECVDERLNTIWYVGKETVQANMLDAYADPWRERGQWWGDAFVSDQVNRVAFGDTGLLRRGIETLGRAFGADGRPAAIAPNNDGTHLLDYGMLWVQSLTQYSQLRPDDTAFLESQYQIARAFADYLESFHAPDTHLIDLPERHWSENGVVDWPAYYSRNGLSAAMNALYAQTMRQLAALAAQLGHTDDSAEFSALAHDVVDELNDLLLVEGRYKATRLDGVLVDAISPHPQAWPLAAGIVPEDRVGTVADAALELLFADPSDANFGATGMHWLPAPDPTDAKIGTYGMYWLLEGLAVAGRHDDALHAIRTYYGYMLDRGATTWWESFEAEGDWSQSLSHAWGAAPTWFLSARVLGAEQVGPRQWRVTPSFDGLEWARGAVPVGQDKLEVSWSGALDRCTDRTVALDVPEGTHGTVVLRRVPTEATVLHDGLPAETSYSNVPGSRLTTDVHIDIHTPGHHAIEVRSDCS